MHYVQSRDFGLRFDIGTGVIVIAPTRELALQIYGVAHELLQAHPQKTLAIVRLIPHFTL